MLSAGGLRSWKMEFVVLGIFCLSLLLCIALDLYILNFFIQKGLKNVPHLSLVRQMRNKKEGEGDVHPSTRRDGQALTTAQSLKIFWANIVR